MDVFRKNKLKQLMYFTFGIFGHPNILFVDYNTVSWDMERKVISDHLSKKEMIRTIILETVRLSEDNTLVDVFNKMKVDNCVFLIRMYPDGTYSENDNIEIACVV